MEVSSTVLLWLELSLVALVWTKEECRNSPITIEDIHSAFYVCKATYDEDIEVGKVISFTGFTVKEIETEFMLKAGSDARVIIAEKGFTTIVAFRGTSGFAHLQQEMHAFIKAQPIHITFNGTETQINSLFWEAFKTLLPFVRKYLENQSRRYVITGHSLGGAIASILAMFMKDDGGHMWENDASCLITFGQPRVGNGAYARKHDAMISASRKLRFVNNLDPVPHEPPWPAYQHHSREVWISKLSKNMIHSDDYWHVCKKQDPLTCSNLWTLAPRFDDHTIQSYEQKILIPPKLFYDQNSRKHKKWLIALNQC